MGLALLWTLAVSAASGQGFEVVRPTQTIFSTGITSPQGGMVLAGTAINPATAEPYRHLWTASDQAAQGLCRIDPDVAAPAPHSINPGTCFTSIPSTGIQFKPGQFAFDPLLNDIYAVDLEASTQGIFRLHFVPGGDSGHGTIDPNHAEVLGGNGIGRHGLTGCGLAGDGVNSVSLGPDGNLYVGFAHSGDIVRVQSPQTEPLPCTDVQVIGSTADNFTDKGLGWIGHDLFGGDGQSLWVIRNADQCMTPANGNQPCTATSFLASQTAVPSMVATDQVYPATNGVLIYVGNPRTITLVNTTNQQVTPAFFSGFQLLNAIIADPTEHSLYVADDPSAGLQPGQGNWWQIVGAPIPGVPGNPLAMAGAGSINLQWSAPAPTTLQPGSYVVRNSFASVGAPLPDIIVAPAPGDITPPTHVTIDGLVNGGVYQFEVASTNAAGTSLFSRPSNLVSPRIPTVPQPPAHVTAAPHDGSATVTWTGTPAYQDGGFPVVLYKVEVQVENQNSGIVVTVQGNPANTSLVSSIFSTTITGLTNGLHYQFVVRANNQMGDSAPSLPSNVVVPSATPQAVVPGAPTNVTAAPSDSSATVSWAPPASNGGAAITQYVIVPFVGNVPTTNVVTVSAPATSANITGLNNGTSYTFVVHAVNAIGAGAPSNPSNSVTPAAAQPAPGTAQVPAVPTNITVTAGVNSAFVAWTTPASDGGMPITSFTVVALSGGVTTGITATVAAPARGIAVNGLSSGATYTFVVHAINAVGDSGPSLPSNPVTLATRSPAAAANLTVSLSGPTTVAPGSNANLTLAVNNSGPAAAPSVTVTHSFTAGSATVVTNSSTQGKCVASSNALVCNLGTLPAGAGATISITLNITAPVLNRSFVQAVDAVGNALVPSNPSAIIAKLLTTTSAATPAQVARTASVAVSDAAPTAGSTPALSPPDVNISAAFPGGGTGYIQSSSANEAPDGVDDPVSPPTCTVNELREAADIHSASTRADFCPGH